MKNIAIIPARSGSKGLKNKNIKLLNGKPLLAYTIEAAIKSGIFDEVMVSTDSNLYAQIAKKYGASVPFLREKKTSTDSATSWETVKEVLLNYREISNVLFDSVTLLQPTSPLRDSNDIIEAFNIFLSKNAKAVVSLTEMEHSPLWCNVIASDHSLKNFIKSNIQEKGRQQLQKYYRINGAIYICRIFDYDNLAFPLYEDRCYAYLMEQKKSIDIDTEIDFKIAKCLM